MRNAIETFLSARFGAYVASGLALALVATAPTAQAQLLESKTIKPVGSKKIVVEEEPEVKKRTCNIF